MKINIFLSLILSFFVSKVYAIDIEEVVSPKLGIKAYLVESKSLPMVNIEVAFRSGNAFEPQDKTGLAYLTTSLLDEGAGDKNSKQFNQAIDSIGALFNVSPGLLNITYSLRTLSEYKQKAFELLGEAVVKPRFDEDAFLRMKDVALSKIKRIEQSAPSVASLILKEALYENHPYGRSAYGTKKDILSLKLADVKNYYKDNFTRANMVVSVVGDISKEELAKNLDDMFKDLPTGKHRNKIKVAPKKITPAIIRKTMNVPQSSIYLAHLGIDRTDKDYYSAYAMNYVLGGGGFNSRLMEEIREKRGLAYSVFSYFEPLPKKGAFITMVSTRNKDAKTSINLIKKEISKIKKHGISDKEYKGAMDYLKGSFPLRLDSSSKVIGYLTTMQMENLGIDYLDNWVKRISSVTKSDIQRVAKRLLHENSMITVIVGGEK